MDPRTTWKEEPFALLATPAEVSVESSYFIHFNRHEPKIHFIILLLTDFSVFQMCLQPLVQLTLF